MPPEARVAAFLQSARRRLLSIDAMWTITAACLGASLALVVSIAAGAGGSTTIGASVVGALAGAGLWRLRAGRWHTAVEIECRDDAFQNTLVTAAELLERPDRAKPAIRDLVLDDTASRIGRVDLSTLAPIGTPLATALVCAAALAIAVFATTTRTNATSTVETHAGDSAHAGPVAIASLTVTITPPSYVTADAVTLDDPDRIEALEGSRVAVRVAADAARLTLADGARDETMAASGEGMFEGSVTLTDQAFLRITAGADGSADAVRLIPVIVTPDERPSLAIDAPGRDMLLPDATSEIPVTIAASDDFGLTSLRLTYTKVSGSGESFEFVEGDLPITITRTTNRAWSATGTLPLPGLGLAAGDVLVYRARARDGHPTRGETESDAFIVEIISGSEAMAEGFAIDDERDAYAISQQMVILKTERLIARRNTLTREALVEESARLAAEQRQVRAEFVFMMGGEVEDEEEEAEHSHEITDGRGENRGRYELVTAIRTMSDAAAFLMKPDLDAALVEERRALDALQRAFSRSRYILRVLSRRERIDESRRLSGDRSTASPWRRGASPAGDAPGTAALHDALRQLSLVARRDAYGAAERATLTTAAEAILAAAPASPHARDAAERLSRAARTYEASAVSTLVDDAALALDAALEAAADARSAAAVERAPHALRSAIADRLRAGGGR